ncbi:LLM class flavin-dependent oxidoreductase [Mycobacterium cookii]|uniref:Luciferase n=1 Tax=Mycobacterium cookii TaxID=1775 RepID=A0A7I7L4M8_9MYCO|nr:LLM class flavin-dependent oxidoreductase [Mycobacterium cookii]MCV7329608.1 LLM class flavin-dependent oxidoreductase [Mycobacterium cookii]BBX48552.1 luciferase [Mycobacterium cookii]
MKLGIGLPVNNPDVLLDWTTRAEATGFSSVAVYDRLAYTNAEALVTLAVLAGATSRIGLRPQILIGPLRGTALLGAQAATLDRLSGGRFTLGMGVGGDRPADFAAAEVDIKGRGARFDQQITQLQPVTPGGPKILLGGVTEKGASRVARHGLGCISALPPQVGGQLIELINHQWAEAGRPGRPHVVGQLNAALGPDAVIDDAKNALAAYYTEQGLAEFQVEHLATSPQQIQDTIAGYADLGAAEVSIYCWSADPSQLDRFSDTVL